jgi:23S rRNA pseudouridine1911/1915/1917 synthase
VPVDVVYEDPHLLVVYKPAGLATTAPGGRDCLVARLERARGGALHPTSRLDAEVTGLVTMARTKRAIAALRDARASGRYGRGYLAIASGAPSPREGTWEASIAIDPREPRLRIAVEAGAAGQRVQRARTHYAIRECTEHACALWLTPHTGRTHQLRVHAAHAGVPLVGDLRYGGPKRIVLADGRVVSAKRVLLHCAWLHLPCVEGDGMLSLSAPVPDDLRSSWAALGGSESALVPSPG